MNLEHKQLVESLRVYIGQSVVQNPDEVDLQPDDELLEDSLVDSMGVMKLIAFINEEFGFAVPPQDITIDHFLTVNAIADYLFPKLGQNVD